jgi:hypothetical protein
MESSSRCTRNREFPIIIPTFTLVMQDGALYIGFLPQAELQAQSRLPKKRWFWPGPVPVSKSCRRIGQACNEVKALYQFVLWHDIESRSMDHKIYEVTSFRVVRPYKLAVQFDDGLSQLIDFEGVLEGELYGPLKDPRLFRRVKLDPELRNLVWPNGADFDPEILHDWPERRKGMIEAAAEWRKHTSVAEKRAGTARGGDGSYSITKRPEGLDHRSRDKSGQIHEKRGDTIVSTLRKHYGEDFARGVSGRMKLETLLRKEKASSLSELLRRHKRSRAA